MYAALCSFDPAALARRGGVIKLKYLTTLSGADCERDRERNTGGEGQKQEGCYAVDRECPSSYAPETNALVLGRILKLHIP